MNILVTGASKGIGRAIAEELKEIGTVFVTARDENSLKALNAAGYCLCDLSEDCEKLSEFIRTNKIDVLINNAGEYIYGGIGEMTKAQICHIFKTKL